jgi:hypothetical protein
MTSPEAKRRLCGSALRKLRLRTAYYIAAFNAKLLENSYWFWESRRSCLADLLQNERSLQ